MDKRKIAIGNARLHAVALDNQKEIVLRVLDAGVFLTVVLLKGQRTVPGAHRAHNRDLRLGITAERIAAHSGGCVRLLAQPQQDIGRGVEDLCQACHGLRIRGGTPRLPLTDSLLRHSQHSGDLRLAVSFGLAGLFQALCKHRENSFFNRIKLYLVEIPFH